VHRPPATEVCPSGQLKQAASPCFEDVPVEHAVHRPPDLEIQPAEQSKHVVAPVSEVLPAEQSKHTLALFAEYVPAEHCLQMPPPGEYVPASHGEHFTVAPPVESVPASQLTQENAPVGGFLTHCPAGQGTSGGPSPSHATVEEHKVQPYVLPLSASSKGALPSPPVAIFLKMLFTTST